MTNPKMKPISIKNPNAIEKLNAAIKEAEGRATARKITAEEIIESLHKIENHLGISKKAMIGISVSCDLNAQTFPNAYKYIPESTWYYAEYRSSGWFITYIQRANTLQSDCRKASITLTEAAKLAILDKSSVF